MIDIQLDTSDLQKLNRFVLALSEKNIRFATAKAITESAKKAQAQLKTETPRYVEGPTRWTLGGTYVQFARPTDLIAEVGFRSDQQGNGNPAGRYLRPLIRGTTPQPKGADLSAAKIANRGRVTLIPARTANLTNTQGNVPLSRYARILDDARTGRNGVFIAPVRRGSPVLAVYQRKEGFISRTSTLESSVRRLFTLDPSPKTRRPSFPVHDILIQAFGQAWESELKAAVDAEIARSLGR